MDNGVMFFFFFYSLQVVYKNMWAMITAHMCLSFLLHESPPKLLKNLGKTEQSTKGQALQ